MNLAGSVDTPTADRQARADSQTSSTDHGRFLVSEVHHPPPVSGVPSILSVGLPLFSCAGHLFRPSSASHACPCPKSPHHNADHKPLLHRYLPLFFFFFGNSLTISF